MSLPPDSLSDRLEHVAALMAEQFAERYDTLRRQFVRPAFQPKRSEEEQALQHQAMWQVLGNAYGPEAKGYWKKIITQHGPREATKFNSAMQRLAQKYPSAAFQGMSPELLQQYGMLRAQGRHLGRVWQPPAGDDDA